MCQLKIGENGGSRVSCAASVDPPKCLIEYRPVILKPLDFNDKIWRSFEYLSLRGHVRPKFSSTSVYQPLLESVPGRRIRLFGTAVRHREIRNRRKGLVSSDVPDPGLLLHMQLPGKHRIHSHVICRTNLNSTHPVRSR